MKKYLAIIIILSAGLVVWLAFFNPEDAAFPEQALEEEIFTPTKTASPTVTAEVSPAVSENEKPLPKIIDHAVPFTAQAPLGGWDDERQQDGCEEASALMAVRWARGEGLTAQDALAEIIKISDYEQATYGEYRDVALPDVINWIFKDYFEYDKVELKKDITINDIINELRAGHLVLAQADGQQLFNPYFTPPGPERHMLVIRGYDSVKKQFITNDPGTRRGESYRYAENILFNAIIAYPTGHHEPLEKIEKNIIVFRK